MRLSIDADPAFGGWRAAETVTAVVVSTYRSWRDDRCIRLGAGLAYYGLFAIVPVLTIAVALADLLFRAEDVQAFLAEPLARLLGQDTADVAARLAQQFDDRALAATLGPLGLVTTLIAASLVFVAFQDALNAIWRVDYESGLKMTVRRRLVGFVVVLLLSGVLVTSLAAQTVVGVLGSLLPVDSGLMVLLDGVARNLVPLAATGVALALLYGVLPRPPVDRRAAVVAGGLTALVAAGGAVVVGWYLQRFGAASAPQAAGSVFVLLTGIYVESQIVLAGAELSKVLSARWRAGGASSPRRDEVAARR